VVSDRRGFERSAALFERARGSMAGGVSTAFRAFERPVPLVVREARGCRLVDVDGNEHIDFLCGMGPVILGHGDPRVTEAVARAAASVQQTGAEHEAEIELAERLCATVRSFERVRLGLSGSEAVQGALRAARAATGRSVVVKFAGHYHGWLDPVLTATVGLPPAVPETAGQPRSAVADVIAAEWNDEASIRAAFEARGGEVAAVIMEPFPCNGGVIPPAPGFLELVRRLCDEHGALLVFDEVITGFRVALGGAQQDLPVAADLTVVAKAMGNGFPVSAFGGRADVMEQVATNRAMHAGTYNGGGVSVAAALATTAALAGDPEAYERMRALGGRLMDGLVRLGAEHGHRIVAQGPGPVFFTWFLDEGDVTSYRDHLRADFARYARFAASMLEQGVRLIPAGRWYLTCAHGQPEIDRALEAADVALRRLTR
jgi:glutamate-1-semialdehyde 2,1-aminomutase